MNEIQKIIKILAIILAIFIIVNIISAIMFGLSMFTNLGIRDDKVVVENFSEIYKDIEQIDIDVLSSNIILKTGNEFKVEAHNLKNQFSSKQINGKLKIEERKRWFGGNNFSGEITIYIPKDEKLDSLKVDAGAGKIVIENIVADRFKLEQGAGIVTISNSDFNKTDIDGGAGKIEIVSSVLNNLKMDAGIGKIEIEAYVTGSSKIECGIGEIKMLLLGNKEEYSIDAEKGLGNIKIEGKDYSSDLKVGTGKNNIDLEGGIGTIFVEFQ